MLMAVEMWVKRDHDAEWKRWTASLDHVAGRVTAIKGITTSTVQPSGLSNRTPSLRIWWNPKQFGVSGDDVARTLLETEPRVALFAAGDADPSRTGVSVTPYMLSPGDERIVADRLHAVLTNASPRSATTAMAPPATDLSGQWEVRIEYAAGVATHVFHLRQRDHEIDGAHQGNFVTRNLSGTIRGDAVRIRNPFHNDRRSHAYSRAFAGRKQNLP